MKFGVFVTGTDTGVGKTLISAALVHACARQGLAAAGMKPVASGCHEVDGRLVSEDVSMLLDAANVRLPDEVVNPYAFIPPLAPHVAAQQSGVTIALDHIATSFRQAQALVDVLVVEGVGGFRVPLNESEDTADLAVLLGLPVVLVVGMRLGCLNHALLTSEAIRARGLSLAGWVANAVDPEMVALKENIDSLECRLQAPCIGKIPFQEHADFRKVSNFLKCERITKN